MTGLTIGLPVYNGEKLLARSLDRLLAQTYSDFTLIISDNASTDDTPNICGEFTKRDRRIRYFRQDANLVWNENFRFVLMQANTPYFMWATHDDLWAPSFAEANIALLEQRPAAVCSVSKIVYFDLAGNRYLAPDTGILTGTQTDRIKRFLLHLNNCGRLYGVYRTDALKMSFPPNLRFYASDWLVVALTMLHGEHLEVGEILLEREAQPLGHYARAFGRTDRFEPQLLDWIVPLHRLNGELRRRLPQSVWKSILPALAYLNLRQSVQMQEYRFPVLKGVIAPLRDLTAELLHRRWRSG